MNGFYPSHGPSLNGLKRSDGSTNLRSLNGQVGDVRLTTNDPTSYKFEPVGDDVVQLATPWQTVDNVLKTDKHLQAASLRTTQAFAAPLKLQAGANITISSTPDYTYTISSSGGGGGGSTTWGGWDFAEHAHGYLNLRRNGRIRYRWLDEPVNIFARVSKFSTRQNGGWSVTKISDVPS